MAKKKQHIDDFFKSQMQGSELPLDGSEWARMSEALGHEKKKRRFFWWWFFGALVLLSGIVGLVYQTSRPSKGQDVNLSSEQAQTRDAGVETSSENIEKVKQTSSASESTNSAIESPPSIMADHKMARVNANNIDKDGIIPPVLKMNHPPKIKRLASSDLNDSDKPVVRDITTFSEFPGWIDPKLVDIVPQIENPWSKKSKIKKKDPAMKLPIYIGITGALQVNQQFTGGENSNTVKSINDNEFASLSSSFGVDFKLFTQNNWTFNGGLNYQMQGQSLGAPFNSNPSITIEIYDSIPVLNPQGDTTDWLPYNYRDTTLNSNLSNPRLNYFSISLGMSRSIPLAHGLGLDLGFEFRPKMLLSTSGTAVSYNSLGENQELNSFNRFGISGGLNLGVHYYLRPNYMIQWDVFGQFDFTDIRRRNDLQQRYGLYGTKVGIYYRIR